MDKTTLSGKKAIKINAEKILWGKTDKASLYRINDQEVWIPNSLCNFTIGDYKNSGDIPGVLIVQEWFYSKLFPNG